jgi:hypothetical protein
MGDVVVGEDEWVKLHMELSDILKDAEKVNSFMVKHVNKKWKVEVRLLVYLLIWH